MADDRLVEVTHKLYEEVFNRGNLSAINECVDANLIEHQPLGPNMPEGREGLRQWVIMIRQAFPDVKFKIHDLVIDGDKVWVRSMMSGTQKGEMMGLPPTGKSVEVEAIDIIRFSQGKMIEHWGVFDQMIMLQQLGVAQTIGEQRH